MLSLSNGLTALCKIDIACNLLRDETGAEQQAPMPAMKGFAF